MKLSYISIPAVMIHSIPANAVTALLASPKKGHRHVSKLWSKANSIRSTSFLVGLISLCFFVSMTKVIILWHPMNELEERCGPMISLPRKDRLEASLPSMDLSRRSQSWKFLRPLTSPPLPSNMTEAEKTLWMQPDNQGFRPCLIFSNGYKQMSYRNANKSQTYLLVIVSGGLNQQRNQIVDAVVIARVLEAALVIPIMQVNYVWKDESEFSDIFDVDHFKSTLKEDVRVVSSLPSTHIMTRPVEEKRTPFHATPQWLRSHYLKKLNREGVLLLRGMDSRLSEDLPPDLQKLRCKVAFHALRFSRPVLETAYKLAQRMSEKGPYVALHLRLEKDVWIRTGCLPGLGAAYDDEIQRERATTPKLLTGRSNMTYEERRVAGLCPLNAAEIARLLKGFGASRGTNIFWAGGQPFGGRLALQPLLAEFSHLYDKDSLAFSGELEPFANKASSLAAIDYVVCLNSDVFMPSHGGNMGHALQGHRAYTGHRKHITPNKREMFPFFLDSSLAQEKLDSIIKSLHNESLGQPTFRTEKKGRDVLAFPVPECMCTDSEPEISPSS